MSKLYFYYSSMNAGKSSSLLQSSFNYKERGMRTILFNFREDDRMGTGVVASRIGISESAKLFDKGTDFIEEILKESALSKIDCILIDEAQFLTRDQVLAISDIVDFYSIPVLAYGLRTDFSGKLFEGSQELLALSDELCEIKSMCGCGKKAIMVIRVNEDGGASVTGNQVEIGGNNRYTSVCRRHYKLSISANKLIDKDD